MKGRWKGRYTGFSTPLYSPLTPLTSLPPPPLLPVPFSPAPPLSAPLPLGSVSMPALPIAEHKATILQAIESHPITIITGETGCGKSTQVGRLREARED